MTMAPALRRMGGAVVASAAALALAAGPAAAADTLFPAGSTPLVAQGSACFGSGCISPGETFGPSLMVKTADTPGVRLNQTGTGGFTPQVWDVAGNEANFFVRDATGGSRLPFRIRPGAPTSAIDIAASGDVGVGTASPTADLDVSGVDGGTQLRVTETSPSVAARTLGALINHGPARLEFSDTATGTTWAAGTTADSGFALAPSAGGTPALTVSATGSLVTAGALQQTADPAAQADAQDVDPQTVLSALRSLPLRTFRYTGEPAGARHMAPPGAAFRAAFGLGASDLALAPGDVAAVALAGVRALAAAPAATDARVGPLVADVAALKTSAGTASAAQTAAGKRIRKLETANRALAKRLKKLEAAVKQLSGR